ncbi:MAG: FtsX-like permease family protein [Thermodesulfobacteriota bacterium]
MKHRNLLFAALGDLIRHPAGSLAVLGCLLTVTLMYLISMGISEGVRFQADMSLDEGADIYVSSDQCGLSGPILIEEMLRRVSDFDGVRGVARVVGRTYFAERLVAVVGLDSQGLQAFRDGHRGHVPGATVPRDSHWGKFHPPRALIGVKIGATVPAFPALKGPATVSRPTGTPPLPSPVGATENSRMLQHREPWAEDRAVRQVVTSTPSPRAPLIEGRERQTLSSGGRGKGDGAGEHVPGPMDSKVGDRRGEVFLGRALADEFGVKPGMPFTLAANKRKLFKAAGTLSPSCLWSSHVLVMHLDDANDFFRTPGQANHALVYRSRSNAGDDSAGLIQTLKADGFRVSDRGENRERLRRSFSVSGGLHSVLLVIGVALAFPTIVVTCGLGMAEQRREIGVLRATGWRTRDVIEKAALGNLVISLAAASVAVLLAELWMRGFNGRLIAQFFVSEVGIVPSVDIPFRLLPSHALGCMGLALVLTETGGIISAWVHARTLPRQSMS